jgi:hypothetical protein
MKDENRQKAASEATSCRQASHPHAGGRRATISRLAPSPFGEGASASAQAVIAIENTRATDDLEHIGGGGLLLEGFAQLIA